MRVDSVEFHNVTDLRRSGNGQAVQRVPEHVRTELNEGAQSNYRRPAGSEIRFGVEAGTARVTLSSPDGAVEVVPYWGPFRGDAREIGEEPTAVELAPPERLADVREGNAYDYHPDLCRLVLPHRSGELRYHGVEGDVRPPQAGEVPDTRYLAYGTSITRGMAASGPHLTYVAETARRLGVDPLNLGTAGSAFCEPEISDHIATRDDWDLATLAISVNMVAGFSVEAFRERADYMVNTVAGENPGKPVVAVTLFPYFADLCEDVGEHGNCEAFREAVREIVRESEHDNVSLLEGEALLPNGAGLTTDLVHPGDHAMVTIGENLAAGLSEVRG